MIDTAIDSYDSINDRVTLTIDDRSTPESIKDIYHSHAKKNEIITKNIHIYKHVRHNNKIFLVPYQSRLIARIHSSCRARFFSLQENKERSEAYGNHAIRKCSENSIIASLSTDETGMTCATREKKEWSISKAVKTHVTFCTSRIALTVCDAKWRSTDERKDDIFSRCARVQILVRWSNTISERFFLACCKKYFLRTWEMFARNGLPKL